MNNHSVAPIRIPILAMLSYVLHVAFGIGIGILAILFCGRQFGGQIVVLFGSLILYSTAVFFHFRFAHGVEDWPSLERGVLWKTVSWGVFMAFVGYVVIAFAAGAWVQNFQGFDDSLHLRPEAQFKSASRHLNGMLALVVTMVDACILAPVAEELLFRSGIYRILKGRLSVVAAASISALLFSISHRSVVASFPLFMLGYLCCWTYEKTADIRGPIIMHAGYNILVSLPLLFRNSMQ